MPSLDKADKLARAYRLYVTGSDSYAAIAERVGLSAKDVERAGADERWREQREAFRQRQRELGVCSGVSLAEKRNAALAAMEQLYVKVVAASGAEASDTAEANKAADSLAKLSKAIGVVKGDASRLEPVLEAIGRLLSVAKREFDEQAYRVVCDVAEAAWQRIQEEYA